MVKSTTLYLAKQNFKFSSAHFLIFNATEAEMLHGHNYQVSVELFGPVPDSYHSQGYFVDFSVIKKVIKAKCDLWDEHVLMPEKHPDMKCQKSADSKNYEIHFRDRFYSLPIKETIWLPITNTSVEQLSMLLADNLFSEFKSLGITGLRVEVQETLGQSAISFVGSKAN
jgi:6-pyruvoyltetrahydropterin/6-carboxytetrahydropterin synthase